MLEDQEIQKILEIKGLVRGVVFQTDREYVLEEKGEAGLKKLEEEIKKTGQAIKYRKDFKTTDWYPLGWRILSLLVIQETFDWGEQEIFKMGEVAPKHSFIVKTILRYFISLEKTFAETAKYWEKHYSIGKLEAPEIDIKKHHLVLRLSDFKSHPILCIYYRGYFKSLTSLIIRASQINIQETKCVNKGDQYHEFVIDWE
ncbi:hypothetical protein KKH07_02685 [Patescibacteria group bacterium]|nr:hypothetical protein [Patescibacteria group bacterium]